MKKTLIILVLLFSSSVVAEQVLYCVEEGSVGFIANNDGTPKQTKLILERFIAKIEFQNNIPDYNAKMTLDDYKGLYHCNNYKSYITCKRNTGMDVFNLNWNNYRFTVGWTSGYSVIPLEDNTIRITYGNCEIF